MRIWNVIKENKEGFFILVKKNNQKLKPALVDNDYLRQNKIKYIVSVTNNQVDKYNKLAIKSNYKLLLDLAKLLNVNHHVFIKGWSDKNNNFFLDLSLGITKDFSNWSTKKETEMIKRLFLQKEIFEVTK